LPSELAEFYARVGPLNITIAGYGNSYFLPSLARLWEFQAGYRWNGLTGELVEDWHADWFVVADQGGDPFIYDSATSKILFAYHGRGQWDPAECFPDLPTMAASLATLGSVIRAAGEDFTDAESYVRPKYRDAAAARLLDILGSREATETVFDLAGWG
jgi:hypothetical protein